MTESRTPNTEHRFLRRRAVAVALGLALGCAVYAAHLALGHTDRLKIAECRANMISVRNALLRYELDRGALPAKLDDLVPAYISDNMRCCPLSWTLNGSAPIAREWEYAYDPAARVLRDRHGHRAMGLWPETAEPTAVRIPVIELTAKAKPPAPQPAPPIPPAPAQPEYGALPDEPEPAAPQTARPLQAPPGALVFEAEHYTALDFGWEVKADSACSGRRFITCKEGVGNNTAWQNGFGDYYGVGGNQDPSRLCYDFVIPAAGTYRILCRMMTTDTHCSNNLQLFLDDNEESDGLGRSDDFPFAWRWISTRTGPVRLTAGRHRIRVYMWEDGLLLDQFLITPDALPGEAARRPATALSDELLAANYVPEAPPDPAPGAPRPRGALASGPAMPNVHVTHDLSTLLIGDAAPTVVARPSAPRSADGAPPVAVAFDPSHLSDPSILPVPAAPPASQMPRLRVWVRKLRECSGKAEIKTVVEAPSGPITVMTRTFDLGLLKPLQPITVDLAPAAEATRARREYLVRTTLRADGKLVHESVSALVRPLDWRILGPLRFISPYERLEVEKDNPLRDEYKISSQTFRWVPFKDAWYEHFGVMDFGLAFSGNSRHARPGSAVYAATEIAAPRDDTYLFRVMGDDELVLWIDGKVAGTIESVLPVTRSALRVPVRLAAGPHRLVFRLNQYQGPWQASIRIRTSDDQISGVTGIESRAAKPE